MFMRNRMTSNGYKRLKKFVTGELKLAKDSQFHDSFVSRLKDTNKTTWNNINDYNKPKQSNHNKNLFSSQLCKIIIRKLLTRR